MYLERQSTTVLHVPCSRNRSKEAELALRIILALQALQTLLSPNLTSIPVARLLVAISIVDIDTHARLTRGSVEDMTQVVSDLGSHLIKRSITRLVSDERSSEDILMTEGESRVLGVGAANGLGGVSFKHKDGSVEGRLGACLGSEELPCVLHGFDVVLFEVKRETRVDEAVLLAWYGINVDLSPSSQVAVVSGLGSDGDGLEVVEWLGDLGVNGLDTLLDQPEKDDGLGMLEMDK